MGFLFMPPTIVGGTVLVISDIRSQNYVTGVSGWAIFANGDAEFFNIFIRGNFSNGLPGTKHIEILQGTNSIDFYSGSVDEDVNGKLEIDTAPGISGDEGFVRLVAPTMDGVFGDVSFLELRTKTAPDVPQSDATLFAEEGFIGGAESSAIWSDTNDTFIINTNSGDVSYTQDANGGFHRFAVLGSDTIEIAGSVISIMNETWHIVGAGGEPAFQNSWTSVGSRTPRFRKYPDGDISIEASFANGSAANAAIFTLPVGYRPPATFAFTATTGAGAHVRGVITSAGVVNFSNGGSTVQTDVIVRFSTLA